MPKSVTNNRLSLAPLAGLLKGQPWVIEHGALDTWVQMVAAELRARGPAALAGPEGPEPVEWYKDGPLAVVPVQGVLTKRGGWWTTGMRSIRAAVEQALADHGVRAIMLDIDSPGGTVDGTQELAEFLAEAAGQKPLYAWVDGAMMSAAYWIGSAAQTIAAAPTNGVGSIGVVWVHVDASKFYDEQFGLKITHLTAGHYKAMGNDAEPLGDEARAYFQGRIDHIYSIFLGDVGRFRGKSPEETLAMADGKVFPAGPAREVGLIDQVMGRDSFISLIKEETQMDLKTLRAEHGGLVEQIEAEARKGMVTEADAQARADQAATEARQGMLALAAAVYGEEIGQRLTAMADAGITPEQLAAIGWQPPQAESGEGEGEAEASGDNSRANILAALKASAPQPAQPAGGQDKAEAKDWEPKVQAYMAEHGCGLAKAQVEVAKANPGLHEAWLEAKNKGEL
jgi:signal peptide peptidase SppA